VPPNPLRPIQQAATRVAEGLGVDGHLRNIGLLDNLALDFGRSMSSIDDLTAEVRQVHKQVDEIELRMEQIVPLLERLVEAAEGLQDNIEPLSSLAEKVPGSGSRRRRREKQQEQDEPASELSAGEAPAGPLAADATIPSPPGGPEQAK
jgi:hypothetical protein